jgi:hypothetical protein
MLRPVALVRADVSGELSASIIRVTRIGELGTTLALTINRSNSVLVKHREIFTFSFHVTTQSVPHRKHVTLLLQSPTSEGCLRTQSLFIERTTRNRQLHFQIIYKNIVRTSQETHYISATKPCLLMLFRETVSHCLLWTIRDTRIHCYGKAHSFLTLKLKWHIITMAV